MQTFRQFADAQRRRAASECDVALARVKQFYSDQSFLGDWMAYLEERLEANEVIPVWIWRGLDAGTQRFLLRTDAVLRNPQLERSLVKMTKH